MWEKGISKDELLRRKIEELKKKKLEIAEEKKEAVERIVSGKRRTRGIEIPRTSFIWGVLEKAKKELGIPYWKIIEMAVKVWWETAEKDITKITEIKQKYVK